MKNKEGGETDLMPGPSENGTGGTKKTLSIWNLFTIGLGAIVGTGWVLLVGDWMVIGGGSIAAMIALAVGAVFLLPTGAVFGELTVAIPISGGIIGYADRIYERHISYITGWFLALGNSILCPWGAIAISTLVSNMLGGLFPILRVAELYTIMGADAYLFPTVVVLGFAVYMVLLNFRGASAAAKLQAPLIKALLTGMLLAMAISFVKGRPSNILPSSTQVEGPSTVTSTNNMLTDTTSALVMMPFLYVGSDTIPQQAEEATEGLNWSKFGRVISMTLLATGGSYMICIYSFGTAIPWVDLIKSTVPALAYLKSISMFLYVAMLVTATLGPMGPINSFYGAVSRIASAIGRKGQPSDSFAVLDKKGGASKMANMALAILIIMGPFLRKNMLISLTDIFTLALIFSCTMVGFTCPKMRHTKPDLPGPYKIPDGKAGICIACPAGAIIVGLMVVPFSPATLKPVEWVIVAAWLVIRLGLSIVARAKGNSKAAAAAK